MIEPTEGAMRPTRGEGDAVRSSAHAPLGYVETADKPTVEYDGEALGRYEGDV